MWQQFLNQYNGKFVDYDGVYGAQCFDLVNKWSTFLGYRPFGGLYASGIYNQPQGNYTQISNSPSAVPRAGDIIVWNNRYGGGYGHTGIATGEGDTNYFVSFDQNYPTGSPAKKVRHSYDGVIGWLRPNRLNTTNGVELGDDVIKPQDRDNVRVINSEVKGWDFNRVHTGQLDDREMQAWVGQPWSKFVSEAWVEGETWRHQRLQKLADYDKLAAQVTELSKNPTKAELQAITDELAKSQAKTAELEKKLAESGNPDDIVVSRGFWNGLFDKIKSFISKG